MKRLIHLAIRLDKAFELWGYGRVDVGAAKDAPGAVSGESEEPANWSQLVSFRKANVGTEWTRKQKGIAAQEAKCRKDAPGAKGVAKAMAIELGITVARLNGLIRTATDVSKRATARSKAA